VIKEKCLILILLFSSVSCETYRRSAIEYNDESDASDPAPREGITSSLMVSQGQNETNNTPEANVENHQLIVVMSDLDFSSQIARISEYREDLIETEDNIQVTTIHHTWTENQCLSNRTECEQDAIALAGLAESADLRITLVLESSLDINL
jgi:hypothetical protein